MDLGRLFFPDIGFQTPLAAIGSLRPVFLSLDGAPGPVPGATAKNIWQCGVGDIVFCRRRQYNIIV